MPMTENGERELRGAVRRLEKNLEDFRSETQAGFREIKRSILGSLTDGKGGLMAKVDRNETDLKELKDQVEKLRTELAVVKRWVDDREAQWRLLMLVSGGNIMVLVGILYVIAKHVIEATP